MDNLMLITNLDKIMDWIKRQVFDEFNIKDLREAKVIIEWEITRDFHIRTLKID